MGTSPPNPRMPSMVPTMKPRFSNWSHGRACLTKASNTLKAPRREPQCVFRESGAYAQS